MNKKIFYIGLSRTGTTSCHHLFSELGLKSIHFVAPLLKNDWEVVNNYFKVKTKNIYSSGEFIVHNNHISLQQLLF